MFQWIRNFLKSKKSDFQEIPQTKLKKNHAKKLEKEEKDLFRQERMENAKKALKEQGVFSALKKLTISYDKKTYKEKALNQRIQKLAQERGEYIQ